MANAEQSVEETVDFITDTNVNNGVTKAVRYFCLDE